MKPLASPPQKILIVKLSAIGDVVQTLPMVEALKARYPQAEIDWLVEEEASDLLIGHPKPQPWEGYEPRHRWR